MLAADEGCLTRFDPVANLGEFEQVFLDDFLEHKARQHSSLSRTANKLREWYLFLVECAGALIRHVPWTRPNRPRMRGSEESAVVIGTYGGEHVGDSAILGGVLTRPLIDPAVEREVSLVTVAGRRFSPAVAKFVNAVKAYRWPDRDAVLSSGGIVAAE